MAILTNFQKIRPAVVRPQAEVLEWSAKVHARAEAALHPVAPSEATYEATLVRMRKLFARFGCSPQRIGHRGMEALEVVDGELSSEIYRIESRDLDAFPSSEIKSGPYGAGMLARTKFYSQVAARTFREFYPESAPNPDHLIHVTCTGYSSPSAAQVTVDEKGWSGKTDITHAYHMGCYAAIPAIRMGAGFVASQRQSVDVVHSELCSLHMNPLNHTPEQLVVYSLFADGHIKYTVKAEADQGLALLALREFVIPGTQEHMSWNSADWGMTMSLSRHVPAKVAEHLPNFLTALLGPDFVKEDAIFAIHPGGPKIIDSIQDLLQLDERQVAHSKDVLLRYGNMSSATLPHIWDSLVNDPNIPSGKEIVSLAFGPGLTIFGARLRKV